MGGERGEWVQCLLGATASRWGRRLEFNLAAKRFGRRTAEPRAGVPLKGWVGAVAPYGDRLFIESSRVKGTLQNHLAVPDSERPLIGGIHPIPLAEYVVRRHFAEILSQPLRSEICGMLRRQDIVHRQGAREGAGWGCGAIRLPSNGSGFAGSKS